MAPEGNGMAPEGSGMTPEGNGMTHEDWISKGDGEIPSACKRPTPAPHGCKESIQKRDQTQGMLGCSAFKRAAPVQFFLNDQQQHRQPSQAIQIPAAASPAEEEFLISRQIHISKQIQVSRQIHISRQIQASKQIQTSKQIQAKTTRHSSITSRSPITRRSLITRLKS